MISLYSRSFQHECAKVLKFNYCTEKVWPQKNSTFSNQMQKEKGKYYFFILREKHKVKTQNH